MIFPVFPKDASSLAAKHLTQSIFNALKNKKTNTGYTLNRALSSGIQNKDSHIGVYAGDADTYRVFSNLLLPVIQEYHRVLPGTVHKSDRTMVTLPDPDPHRRYILSTRIRVARNLKGYAFTPFIDTQHRKRVEHLSITAFKELPSPFSGEYISMDCTHDILFKKGDRFQDAAGINRDWPASRGCFMSHDTRFRVWINEEDHLRVISMDNHGDMATTFNRLVTGLELLEKKLNFAWDDTLGYLASCPSNIGTGMRAGVHIRLPHLFQTPEILHGEAKKLNLQVRGTRGEKTRVEDAVFDISNEKRLGITEKDCIKTLHRGIVHLIRLEALQSKSKH